MHFTHLQIITRVWYRKQKKRRSLGSVEIALVAEVGSSTKCVPRRGVMVALVPKASTTEVKLLLLICESVRLAWKASAKATLLTLASESVLVLAALLASEAPALLATRTGEAARLAALPAAIIHMALVSLHSEATVLSTRATTPELITALGIAEARSAFPIETMFSKRIGVVMLATICKSRVRLPVEAAIEAAIDTAIEAVIETAVRAGTFPPETSCISCTFTTHAVEVVTLSSVAPCLAIHETLALPFFNHWRCRRQALSEKVMASLTTPRRSIEPFSTFPETLAMSFPRQFLLVRRII